MMLLLLYNMSCHKMQSCDSGEKGLVSDVIVVI